jgi:hypothetical protein
MEMSGQRHAVPALPPVKSPVQIIQEGLCAPQPVWAGVELKNHFLAPRIEHLTVQHVTSRCID